MFPSSSNLLPILARWARRMAHIASMEAPLGPNGSHQPLLLFDGECGLCARSIRFVLDRERSDRLHFASLQSSLGREIVTKHGFDPDEVSTLVLVEENGRVSRRSTAALRVAKELRWPWRWAPVFLLVPRFLRDGVYRIIAKHRLRFFGNADSCRLPTPSETSRFLG